jgi:hypothetical protein
VPPCEARSSRVSDLAYVRTPPNPLTTNWVEFGTSRASFRSIAVSFARKSESAALSSGQVRSLSMTWMRISSVASEDHLTRRGRSREATVRIGGSGCCLAFEAVAQTPGEPARPFLTVGSENGHLVGHAHVVRREVVAHGRYGVPFRERAAAF